MSREILDIDEASEAGKSLAPLVRLAHLLIRECLQANASGCTLARANNEQGVARISKAGDSQEVMRFPMPVHVALVELFGSVAGAEWGGAGPREGSIAVRWHGVTHQIGVRVRRGAEEVTEAQLQF